jgi:hypothetical protein
MKLSPRVCSAYNDSLRRPQITYTIPVSGFAWSSLPWITI